MREAPEARDPVCCAHDQPVLYIPRSDRRVSVGVVVDARRPVRSGVLRLRKRRAEIGGPRPISTITPLAFPTLGHGDFSSKLAQRNGRGKAGSRDIEREA